jgi:hypothetical protein
MLFSASWLILANVFNKSKRKDKNWTMKSGQWEYFGQAHLEWDNIYHIFSLLSFLTWFKRYIGQTWKNTKSLHNLNSIYLSYTILFLAFIKEIAGKMKKFTQIWNNLHKHGLQVCAFFHVWHREIYEIYLKQKQARLRSASLVWLLTSGRPARESVFAGECRL